MKSLKNRLKIEIWYRKQVPKFFAIQKSDRNPPVRGRNFQLAGHCRDPGHRGGANEADARGAVTSSTVETIPLIFVNFML